ncbi:MAG: tetratricopeptide repeat protein [Telluria sp.]
MSLINKMLQDLDARGSAPGASARHDIKSVLYEDGGRTRTVAIAGIAAVTLAVAVGAGWWWMKRTPAPKPAVAASAAPQAVQVNPVPLVRQVPPELVDEPEPEPQVPAPVAVPEPVAAQLEPASEVKPKPPKAAKQQASTPAPKAASAEKPAAKPAAAGVLAASPAPGEAGLQVTPRQRAESEYRRALAGLQEGRVTEAMAALNQAIGTDPRHEAARQTLVGLLIEAGRKGEAMHVLRTGLTLDLRQPAMAMLLARLQIEGGTSGIDTLMRTLPYASGNAEYHAFLAGALARDERHREAAEQYQAALRAAPSNGIWWMGLGLSLQAEKRNAEAVAAFGRARDSANLTPQLRTFVERKLQGLTD